MFFHHAYNYLGKKLFYCFLVCYLLVQAGGSVDSFLESLGLEKYSTAFKVEEVFNIRSWVVIYVMLGVIL